jgi:cell division protein ZapA (FtsZ GTPase activity inhibitor)
MESVQVVIGNQEYKLKGDLEIIQKAALEVNNHFEMLNQQIGTSKTNTVPILTALNIAEEKILSNDRNQSISNYISAELDKMIEFLKDS